MKQFAIIGLDNFGRRVLDELLEAECEILIIDKDEAVIDLYKEKVENAIVADVINEETINKVVPWSLDAAIIDLGDNIEASILVTNYLKKLGVPNIVVKAESKQHGEILDLVGATRVVFPNKEAALRIAPLLLSSLIFSYLPISEDFIIAELKTPERFHGKTLLELNLRKEFGINVIAFREDGTQIYNLFTPDHTLKEDENILICGREEAVTQFSNVAMPASVKGITGLFKRFFSQKQKEDKS